MSEPQLLITVVVIMVLLLALGMKVSFALGLSATVGLLFLYGDRTLLVSGLMQWGTANSFALTAVPLFVLMGELLMYSGSADDLFSGLSGVFRPVPGGLMHSAVWSCAVFAAVTGSSVATAATVGSVSYPLLVKNGYSKSRSAGVLAAGGTLGIIIPPSLPMILYGTLAQESISRLFMAGVVPGVILTVLFSTFIVFDAVKNPQVYPGRTRAHLKEAFTGLSRITPTVLVILLVLGALYTGVATPTESAAIGVVGALAVTAGYRRLNLELLRKTTLAAVRITSMIVFISLGAMMVGIVFGNLGLTTYINNFIAGLGVEPYVVLFFIIIIICLMGMFMDGVSILLISTPILVPIISALGFDLIWFGVIFTILLEVALLTPPVALNLFVLGSVTELPTSVIFKGTLPFLVILLLSIALFVIFPHIVLWLPSRTMG